MTTATSSRLETERLADQLERAFRGGSWHGPALGQVLDAVGAAAACRRPLERAHTIWEIVLHVTVWIDTVRRRLGGDANEDPPPELDWQGVGDRSNEAWQATLSRLEQAHRRLHATVLELDDSRLEDPVAGSDPTIRGLLLGLLQHTVYHAGQIAILGKADAGSGGEA
jgi:uncharacterized damage-inducible protein DinB